VERIDVILLQETKMKKEEEATFLNLAKEDRIAKRNRNANARLAVTSTHNDPVGS